jgi:hypothetical protein
MATDEERAQELYDQLKPEAEKVYIDHIASRTPPELYDEVKALAQADLAPEPPTQVDDPTKVTLTNGDSVVVKDAVGAVVAGSPGTVNVANAALTDVTLGPVAQRQTAQRQTAPRR